MSLLDATLRFFVVEPKTPHKKKDKISCKTYSDVASDRYIFLPLSCLFVNVFIFRSTISTKVPFMTTVLGASEWQIGMVLLIPTAVQLTGQFMVGQYASIYGKWIFVLVGLILNGIGVILWTAVNEIWVTLGPETILRVGWSTVMTVIMPLVGQVVDSRHGSQHGTIYGMYFATYHFASFSGPVIGGLGLEFMSFHQYYRIAGVIAIFYSMVALTYKEIPPRKRST